MPTETPEAGRTTKLARTIGTAAGKIRNRIAPRTRSAATPGHQPVTSSIGATEDQVNMNLQLAQRIDNRGTKAEDLAGTGAHDSQGG